ncbi:MAG TPA: hypothetical protein DCY20_06735 [Firmicutes bacterium]|nr:hypothetical protein [Bacillota bacterium]
MDRMRSLILYDSKYGATEKMASILGMVVGQCCVKKVVDFTVEDKSYDYYILGSPIYSGKITNQMIEFLRQHYEWLRTKKVFFYVVDLEGASGDKYLHPIRLLLGTALKLSRSLGGYLQINGLDAKDYEDIQAFCDYIGLPFQNMNYYDLKTVVDFGLDVKALMLEMAEKLDEKIVWRLCESFIKLHNTCVLCTGHDELVRATPIEYSYYKKKLYFMSEGGVKFANLFMNAHVSVAIFDPFTTWETLAGMQISGQIEMVPYKCDEFYDILKQRNISQKEYDEMKTALHVFKLNMEQIEFLNSSFKEYGGSASQVLKLTK